MSGRPRGRSVCCSEKPSLGVVTLLSAAPVFSPAAQVLYLEWPSVREAPRVADARVIAACRRG